MMTNDQLKQAAKKIFEMNKEANGGVAVGIRSLREGEDYKAGDDAQESYGWDYDQDVTLYGTEESSGATATTNVTDYLSRNYVDSDIDELVEQLKEAIDFNQDTYWGEKQAILVGYGYEEGMDDREWDLYNAEVVAVFDR